jgi:NAD(P)-dependent dehydrogenase (short-subunit alcohol dehydrogenase family)
VLLVCRNLQAGEALVQEMAADAAATGRVLPPPRVLRLDLSSLASVRECAAQLEREKETVHVLVGNAGIFSMSGPRALTADGLEVSVCVIERESV